MCVKWNLVVLIPKNKQNTSHRTWFVDTLKPGWLEPTSLRMCIYIYKCMCVYTNVYVYVCINVLHMCIYIDIDIDIDIHTDIDIYI